MTATEAVKTNGPANGANGSHQIGRWVVRLDAVDKVTGRAQYTADLHLPGMCYGMFLRSPYAHARITAIDTTRRDHAGRQRRDHRGHPVLGPGHRGRGGGARAAAGAVPLPQLGDKVKYHGAKIAAVAAVTREIAEEACARIKVEYELLPPVVDVQEAIKEGAVLVNDESTRRTRSTDGPFAGHPLHNMPGEPAAPRATSRPASPSPDRVFEDTYIIPPGAPDVHRAPDDGGRRLARTGR